MQRYVNEQQCNAAQMVAMEIRTQLEALRSLQERNIEDERSLSLQTTKLVLRLEELEVQLVETCAERENATKNMNHFQTLLEVERTTNQQAVMVICELERERDTMKRRIDNLERESRAKKSRDRLFGAANKVCIHFDSLMYQLHLCMGKVLQAVRRRRRVAEAVSFMYSERFPETSFIRFQRIFMTTVSEVKARSKQAGLRALVSLSSYSMRTSS